LAGLRTRIGLVILVIVLLGVGLGAVQINAAVTELNNCGQNCFDIERAFLGIQIENTIPQKLTIVLLFVFHNPTPMSAYVVNLPFVVEIAGVEIGTGELCCLPFLVPSNGRVEAAGIIDIPFSQIPSLVGGSIEQYQKEGTLQYRVHGTVTLRSTFLGIMIPLVPNIIANFDKQDNFA
jgi:LEA14-like dessication related protein